jgi:tetratricopeptide (TPR) repeat protein
MNKRLKFGFSIAVFGLTTTTGLLAQNVTPEVQALYQQAQEAQAANHAELAVADYRKILKLAPDLAPAYNNLGRLFYNLGRFPDAISTLTKGLSLAPEMPPAQVMLGASYFKLGQFNEALSPLEAGVKAMPDDRFAHVTLAQTLIGLNRPQDAVPQVEAVLASNPKDQQAWYLLGKLHLQLSQKAFAQVQSIDPSSSLAHELAGEIMESMQDTPGAVDAYKQAVAAAPEDAAPLEHLADLYWHTGDWPHARDVYNALLLKEPGNCFAHWKLANSLDELGDTSASGLQEINTALNECPSLPQAHAERARLLLRLGKPADALPDLEIAERAAPDEPSVQQLLAHAYLALGDHARADAANRRFVELEKKQRDAKQSHAERLVQANQ